MKFPMIGSSDPLWLSACFHEIYLINLENRKTHIIHWNIPVRFWESMPTLDMSRRRWRCASVMLLEFAMRITSKENKNA